MEIVTQYKGNCFVCRKPIFPGQKVDWVRDRPTRHWSCRSESLKDAFRFESHRELERLEVFFSPEHGYVIVLAARSEWDSERRRWLHEGWLRRATADESMPSRRKAERQNDRSVGRAAALELFAKIEEEGGRPVVKHGDGLLETPGVRYYLDPGHLCCGAGRWFVVGPEKIWAVLNNCSDGCNWMLNNVRVSVGRGAIGHWVDFDRELAEDIDFACKAAGVPPTQQATEEGPPL